MHGANINNESIHMIHINKQNKHIANWCTKGETSAQRNTGRTRDCACMRMSDPLPQDFFAGDTIGRGKGRTAAGRQKEGGGGGDLARDGTMTVTGHK